VWRVGEEVSAAAVMERVKDNLAHIQKTIVAAIPKIAALQGDLPAHQALQHAIMTPKELVPVKTLEKLRPIVGKYFSEEA
jgi:hypothetical protein